MQAARPHQLQSAINVTPLVDVVLVLLIIFMIVAPQMLAGPNLNLPTTDRPQPKPDDGRRVVVAIERGGKIWIGGDEVDPGEFQQAMRAMAGERAGVRVLIRGDARLTFGEVRQAMRAIESVGFKNVGLVTERRDGQEG